jgi:hypothetical protein
MRSVLRRCGRVVVVILLAASAAAMAKWHPAGRCLAAEPPTAAAPATDEVLDPAALAHRIDRLLEAAWTAEQVEPSPPADDAEFLRRVFLDLTGRIPSVAEVREFLDDRDPQKRGNQVEQLLQRATFPAHFGRMLRDLMLPGSVANPQLQFLAPQFEAWLRLRLEDGAGYDRLVTDLLTYAGAATTVRGAALNAEPNPGAFYQVNERRPENLAASTSRLFLGVQLECAQCHNHPFAKWKREEFWAFAAFFNSIDTAGRGDLADQLARRADPRGIRIPGTDTMVSPKLLDGTEPDWQPNESMGATLARWMTSASNPYFARATVNRVWWQFFGRGLIDPVDDLDESNVASQPDVLDELTRQFRAHRFDFKFLARAITSTRAYQLSSRTTHASQDDPRHFARMPLRSLTAEQLYDSLVQATGFDGQFYFGRGEEIVRISTPRAAFLSKFSDTGPSRTDYQGSILQALTMMNGRLTADASTLQRGATLQAVSEAPFLSTADKIETLFLATLSRKPTRDELITMELFVRFADTAESENATLADVFWALLNSAEFVLNH